MAYYARAYYPADNDGDTVFAVPFQYISQAHVKVYYKLTTDVVYLSTLVEGVDYSWTSTSQITLTDPRPNNWDILIKRVTPLTVLATQQAGVVSSAKLNLNSIQRQYVDEELSDGIGDGGSLIEDFNQRLSTVELLVGAAVGGMTAVLGESIGDGSFVNFYFDTELRVRKALASDPTRWAHGFVSEGGSIGASLPVSAGGLNVNAAPGAFGEVWLSDSVAGGFSYTPPTAPGSIIQPLGLALPARGVLFTAQQRILL